MYSRFVLLLENLLGVEVMNNGYHQPQDREGESDDGYPAQSFCVLIVLSERLQRKHKHAQNPFQTVMVHSRGC